MLYRILTFTTAADAKLFFFTTGDGESPSSGPVIDGIKW